MLKSQMLYFIDFIFEGHSNILTSMQVLSVPKLGPEVFTVYDHLVYPVWFYSFTFVYFCISGKPTYKFVLSGRTDFDEYEL